MIVSYCSRCGKRNDVRVWPASTSMPPIDVCTCPPSGSTVVQHNLLTEGQVREMVRALVAEELAKLTAQKPMVCALCGKRYEDTDSGWCGHRSVEFCSLEHMNQWLKECG